MQNLNQDPSGPLERYVRLLEVLATFPGSLTSPDIAALLSLPKATAHRLLKGLSRSGLVQGGGNRPYALGERLLRLVHAAANDDWLTSLVQPHLRALTDRTGETCYVTRLIGARVVVFASLSPDVRWRGYAQPGIEMPINAAASAKAIMAWQNRATVEEALSHEMPLFTVNTRNDLNWVEEQLAEARSRGYATCIGEIDEGLAAVAVPVRLSNGLVLHAVAMTGPLQRIMNGQLSERLDALREAARTLAAPLSIGERLKSNQEIPVQKGKLISGMAVEPDGIKPSATILPRSGPAKQAGKAKKKTAPVRKQARTRRDNY
ncbi:IclR family transcriptional regulator [Bradyrhizobium sp. USDA 4451]